MQVRIFESPDMATGLKQIKKEMGPDALILSTRTIRTGKLGLLGKPMLEITAAIDYDYPQQSQNGTGEGETAKPGTGGGGRVGAYLNQMDQAGDGAGASVLAALSGGGRSASSGDARLHDPQAKGKVVSATSFSQVVDNDLEAFLMHREKVAKSGTGKKKDAAATTTFQVGPSSASGTAGTSALSRQQGLQSQSRQGGRAGGLSDKGISNLKVGGNGAVSPLESTLRDEVDELKNLMQNLAGQLTRLASSAEEETRRAALTIQSTDYANRLGANAICGDHILSLLINRGVNIESARTITGFLRESLTDQELSDQENIREMLISVIQSLLEVSPPDFTDKEGQKRIALVGPTGVGKTTTLAKIAALYLSRFSNSVAMITIDTYRIAAVEQLKVYGEIMNVPVEVVITPEQLEQALMKHRSKELILIDTAGRSPQDSLCIDDLFGFLRPEFEIDKHLVLSATTRENELIDIVSRFNKLHVNNTIFTKIDECTNLGILLNIQIQNSSPLAYLTNGQRVPEDLMEINSRVIAELIVNQHQGSIHE